MSAAPADAFAPVVARLAGTEGPSLTGASPLYRILLR